MRRPAQLKHPSQCMMLQRRPLQSPRHSLLPSLTERQGLQRHHIRHRRLHRPLHISGRAWHPPRPSPQATHQQVAKTISGLCSLPVKEQEDMEGVPNVRAALHTCQNRGESATVHDHPFPGACAALTHAYDDYSPRSHHGCARIPAHDAVITAYMTTKKGPEACS